MYFFKCCRCCVKLDIFIAFSALCCQAYTKILSNGKLVISEHLDIYTETNLV